MVKLPTILPSHILSDIRDPPIASFLLYAIRVHGHYHYRVGWLAIIQTVLLPASSVLPKAMEHLPLARKCLQQAHVAIMESHDQEIASITPSHPQRDEALAGLQVEYLTMTQART